MAALLIVGEKCEYCVKTIDFVRENPVLIPLVQVHNVSKHGLPEDLKGTVKRVPTLITTNGQHHVGIEVIRWLETNVPCTFEGIPCSNFEIAPYNEPYDDVGDGFPLDAYGISLSPIMTESMKNKIERPTNEAYQELKTSLNEKQD
jgi:hypothetical protein